MATTEDFKAGISSTITPEIMRAYFRSIEGPFRDTHKERRKKTNFWNVLVVVMVLMFAFSAFPIIPFVLVLAVPWLLGADVTSLWNIRVPVGSFWFWWVTSVAFSMLWSLIFNAVGNAKIRKSEVRWLAKSHMRFAYCYGIAIELSNYKTNHLNRHIETAETYLKEITRVLLRTPMLHLVEPISPETFWDAGLSVPESNFSSAPERFQPYWFRIQPETKAIMSAFATFYSQVADRIKDKKDLTSIEAAVTDLANFFYTEIPEVSDGTDRSALRELGLASLQAFSQKISDLPPYQSEERRRSSDNRASSKLAAKRDKMIALFNHNNPLIAFLAWYILNLLLFAGGFYIAFRYIPNLRVDSTLVTAMVGGPIASAIAAVSLSRVNKTKNRPE